MRTTLLGLGLTSLLVACGTDVADDQPPPPPPEQTTWYQDVAPIVSKHCMGCHQDGGVAPFALTEFSDAHENAMRMIKEIDKGSMPPFDAREESDCTPRFDFQDDPRLSSSEIQTIRDWIDDGAPEGTKANIDIPAQPVLTNITKTLRPAVPFTATGDRDQFICFLLDPGYPNGAWLTGLQVRPGNDQVVHHVVINEVQPGPELTALEQANGIGMPFDCGDVNQPGFAVGLWTPGNQPMQMPADMAVPIAGGAKFLINIHYHPTGGVNQPDATEIDIRTSTTTWPKKMYFVFALGNAFQAPTLLPGPGDRGQIEFNVPPNVADHTEHMRITVPDISTLGEVRVYSAMPHMHLIGTHISGKIERPAPRGSDPQNECLANGKWNFDWQRSYIYDTSLDTLPTVATGDVIDIFCKFDNTIQNPFVQRLLYDQHLSAPFNVALGEETTNEMCLEIFGVAINAPPQPTARTTPMLDDLPMTELMKMDMDLSKQVD